MILIICWGCQVCYAYTDHYGEYGAVTLKEIDLKRDKVLYDIIRKEIQSDKSPYNEEANFYSVYISDYADGALVNIVSDTYDNIFGNINYNGYFVMQSDTIVFCVNGNYSLPFVKPLKTKFFKTYNPYPAPYDPKESRYFISNGAFGWVVENVGWVWVIPDEITIKSKNNHKVVPVPKRTSKK